MAARTGRTPRAMRQREGNYEDPGVKGRATGITLAPRPLRDDGMEETAGLFSSPEKSPPKPNGLSHHSTVIELEEDETMNIGSSTIPEPTEVIKARNGKSILPPPKSRSPIKTSLGSAARRSLGPRSSPSRGIEHDTPTHRAMSNPPNRLLDFSKISETSAKGSVSKGKLPATRGPKSKPSPMSGKRKRDLFDLPPDQDEEPSGGETSLVNGTSLEDTYDDNQNMPGDNFDDSLQLPNGGDVSHVTDDQLPQDENTISPSIEKDTTAIPMKTKGKRGRPAASTLAQVETANPTHSPGRRGRPPKKPRIDAPEEDAVEGAAEPRKKPSHAQAAAMQPPKPRGGRGRQALALSDPNTKLQPRRRASRSVSKGPLSPSKTRFITRSETPGDELSFRTTRAGRNVVKPLAFWRGESAVFGGGRLEEGNLVLPSIKEVIRTEEVPEPRRRKTPGQPRRRRKPARRPEDDELPEEEDDDEEYWETEGGVMRASVMLWDPTTGRGDEENIEEADVAYAAAAIEMRDISGADFRFAKTLTLPFFGSGMVDLPPGGTKRVKNSRKMQMVFFVFYGRVTVDLGTPAQRFSIGRGGMWQVPRGNFYAISNTSTKPARIFFAQGCEVAPESAGFDESGAA
ncbi:MAG: hypothetical protein L6R38_008613 [Xanthoria sp. 2 TBL-2021]|nr:MAG: hypothetical protein L6R38_008613 [Xanthoria sp. 2 TBL-2021]